MRTLLIVEDDPDLSNQYRMLWKLALAQVPEISSETKYQVRQVHSYTQALEVLAEGRVAFMSVDLALKEQERGLGDADRAAGREAGGMLLLRESQKLANPPMTVIVSGETLLSYARDSLQKYGALAYFQKDQPDFQDVLTHTMRAAIWYLEAVEWVDRLERFQAGPEAIDIATMCWDRAMAEAAGAYISERNFPSNIVTRLGPVRDRLLPNSRVPGVQWTEAILRRRVLNSEDWIMMQMWIRNYAEFANEQASQVHPLIVHLAGLTEQACKEYGCSGLFLGSWHSDTLIGPCLVALLVQDCTEVAVSIAEHVTEAYQSSAGNFVHGYQLGQGHGPLPQLGLKLWYGTNRPFADWPDLMDRLSRPHEQRNTGALKFWA